MAELKYYKNEILIEVRKNHFSKHYAIRIVDINDPKKPFTKWSQETNWSMIKKFLLSRNIDCPTTKEMRLLSDGFEYSYGWFDAYGKVA